MPTKHGESQTLRRAPTTEYRRWHDMLTRCRNPNATGYQRYGGRGISVCDCWLDYRNFLADMGRVPTPAHTMERIDNNGNYEPGNVRWATRKEQARNTRHNVNLTYDGRTQCLSAWAEELGVDMRFLWERLRYGWSPEKILYAPKPTEKCYCKRGHPLFGKNLRMEAGRRRCRACQRIACQKRDAKRKEAKDECRRIVATT